MVYSFALMVRVWLRRLSSATLLLMAEVAVCSGLLAYQRSVRAASVEVSLEKLLVLLSISIVELVDRLLLDERELELEEIILPMNWMNGY